TIETVPYEPRLFSRPKPVVRLAGKSEVSERELGGPVAALPILGGRAYWLGQEWRGLRLTSVKKEEWTAGYGRSSGREPVRGLGVRLTYTSAGQTSAGQSGLVLYEAASCQFAFVWMCQPGEPEEGMVLLRGPATLL